MAHSHNGAPPPVRPIPRLAVHVEDIRSQQMVVRWFFRSPVTVGRKDWNTLCLEARDVADYQGAFVFAAGYLRFVDLQPAGGTVIDGVPAAPDTTVELDETSVILIGPFRVTVRLDLVAAVAPSGDVATRDAPPAHELLGRALEVVEAVAAFIINFRGAPDPPSATSSPLTRSADVFEIMAYLLDPDADGVRLAELLALLRQVLTPRR